jgi:alpha-1,2-mannosyltransferase
MGRVLWKRFLRMSPALLVASELARLLLMLLPNGFNFVDLRVYAEGAARLSRDDLYDFAHVTGDGPLPFTYPPFAAVVFYPLHFLPFVLTAILWQLLSIAALYLAIRSCFQLLRGPGASAAPRRLAIGWTVLAMWAEPVRVTLDLGQVNLFLLLAALLAARSTRWGISGLLIGVAAGIKLTPAIGGLYLLARRRWAAALWSAAVFVATMGISYAIAAHQTRRYFTTLLGDANRIGPVGSVWNQSLRGTISRFAGHDVATGWPWLAAAGIVAVLAVLAWRTLSSGDLLGAMLMVQLLGLMLSPISWLHHFVWLIPLALWLSYGPEKELAGARVVCGCWLSVLAIGPWALGALEKSVWVIPRPLPVAGLDAVYVAGVIATYCWLIWAASRSMAAAKARSSAVSPPAECVETRKVTVRQRISMSGW